MLDSWLKNQQHVDIFFHGIFSAQHLHSSRICKIFPSPSPMLTPSIDFPISSKRKCHQIVTPFPFSWYAQHENGMNGGFQDRWTPHPFPGALFLSNTFFCGRKRFSFLEGLKIDGKKEATLFPIPSFLSHGENY